MRKCVFIFVDRADINIINSSGQNALEIAKFWNHPDIVELLTGDTDKRDISLYNKVILYFGTFKTLKNFFFLQMGTIIVTAL